MEKVCGTTRKIGFLRFLAFCNYSQSYLPTNTAVRVHVYEACDGRPAEVVGNRDPCLFQNLLASLLVLVVHAWLK